MSVFNPNEHLKVMKDQDGNPIFDVLENNGMPVLQVGPDGSNHFVMMPRRYLDANGYRQWFYSVNPEGSIEVTDLSPEGSFDAATSKFIESPVIKVLVRLYADRSNREQSLVATSYGMIRAKTAVDPNDGSMGFELAQAIALKNAMANAGFIYDASSDIIEDQAKYLEFTKMGDPVDLVKAGDNGLPLEPANIKESTDEPGVQVSSCEDVASGILAYMASNVPEPASERGPDASIGVSVNETEPEEKPVLLNEKHENTEDLVEISGNDKEDAGMDLEDALRTVVEVLPDGMPKFGRFDGLPVGEAFDAKLLAYIASHDFAGKLSDATLKAVMTLV